jgi:hypothetical protein
MIAQLIVTLERMGFKPEEKCKGYSQIFNYGKKNVSIEQDETGLWVFVDDGMRKIYRQKIKSEQEAKVLAQRIEKYFN